MWDEWNFLLYGYDAGNGNDTGPKRDHDDKVYQPSVDPNFDFANWNLYQIRWYPDRTEFYVNGNLERTEREVKPDDALQIHFNIWAPVPQFGQAYNRNLPGPVDSPTDPNRKIYNFDVDYVRVTSLTGGTSAARVERSNGFATPLPVSPESFRR